MMNCKWRYLQLFAGEGAGASGGIGGEGGDSASGENAVDAGRQRLLELGVPEEKIRKRAYKFPAKSEGGTKEVPESPKEPENKGQDAAVSAPAEEEQTEKPSRMSWDEIMKDPEYNKEMQAVVQSRLKTAKVAEETLTKLTPALEVLARKHNLDPENMDYDALSKAIHEDSAYYEDKALELGVSVETAKKIDQQERETAREQREKARTLERDKILNHIRGLEQQGEAMKKTFPGFNLKQELKNPIFARMTSPNGGVSVEDAYYAIHRKEIQAAAMQVTAQKTAEKIANDIRSGSRRPEENGTSAKAPSVTSFDYRNASKEQRDALKKAIYDAKANGTKLYPGGFSGR